MNEGAGGRPAPINAARTPPGWCAFVRRTGMPTGNAWSMPPPTARTSSPSNQSALRMSKLAILLWSVDLERPDLAAAPFVHAAAATALDAEVEVHRRPLGAPARRRRGRHRSTAERGGRSLYAFMQDAAHGGARFLACSMAWAAYVRDRKPRFRNCPATPAQPPSWRAPRSGVANAGVLSSTEGIKRVPVPCGGAAGGVATGRHPPRPDTVKWRQNSAQQDFERQHRGTSRGWLL